MAIRRITVTAVMLAPRDLRRLAVNAMTYKSERVDVAQMFDELVAADHTRHVAAVELGAALKDRTIILEFAGLPVVDEIAPIAQFLRDFALDPHTKPTGWAVARWVTILQRATAARPQFEIAFGFAEAQPPPSNRRFVSDDELVAEGVEGIRSGRWPNALQAAKALAAQADGASPESIIDRLRKKIKEAGN
jgi:hypothetical protein